MIKKIIKIYNLFDNPEKKEFFQIQVYIILMTLFELITLTLMGLFISLLNNGYKDQFIIHGNYYNSALTLGLISILSLLISLLTSIYGIKKISIFSAKIGINIGNKLYEYYLNQDWGYHLRHSGLELTKNISTEATRVAHAVIEPLIQINSKIFFILFLGTAMLIYSPKITLLGILLFSAIYFTIYYKNKYILNKNGIDLTSLNKERFKLVDETFNLTKEILLFDKNKIFIDKFFKIGEAISKNQSNTNTLASLPRFYVEFFIYLSIIVSLIYAVLISNINSKEYTTSLIIIMFAGFKLLPNFNQLYSNFAVLRSNLHAFDKISGDMIDLTKENYAINNESYKKSVGDDYSIYLNNVSYEYKTSKVIIKNIDLKIEKNITIGIVGKSGSGKSTLLDIITGLIDPTSGYVSVGTDRLDSTNKKSWQNRIGYVPQLIYLMDSSVRENIVFSFDNHKNEKKLYDAMESAGLKDFLQQDKINDSIGRNGNKLSGGQRQRLVIARALYENPDVLIFDEATSALDNITEKIIIDFIDSIKNKKTIIMVAHKLNTVKNCDRIYVLDSGKIIDSGSYQELKDRNSFISNSDRI